jgi:hypothetical protein
MKRALTIAIVAVCFAAPLYTVSARSRGPERSSPAAFISDSINPYSAAPRIIHVPDAHDRASLDSDDWPDDDGADLRARKAPMRTVPVHRQHPVITHVKPHRTVQPKSAPHRRPYSASARDVPPPAPVEHRAILSAPPLPVDGPTPIRPTPRFGAPVPKPHSADQQTEAARPVPAAPTASEPEEVKAESAISPIPQNAPAQEQPAAPAEQ